MKSHIYRLSLFVFLLGVFTLNIALADDIATDEIGIGSIAVTFYDLNLSSSVGLDSLYRRVESAARRVCGVQNFKVSLDIVRKNRECVSSSISNAIEEIGDARLIALHRSKLSADHQS